MNNKILKFGVRLEKDFVRGFVTLTDGTTTIFHCDEGEDEEVCITNSNPKNRLIADKAIQEIVQLWRKLYAVPGEK